MDHRHLIHPDRSRAGYQFAEKPSSRPPVRKQRRPAAAPVANVIGEGDVPIDADSLYLRLPREGSSRRVRGVNGDLPASAGERLRETGKPALLAAYAGFVELGHDRNRAFRHLVRPP